MQPASSCAFAISANGSAVALDRLPSAETSLDAAFVWTHLYLRQSGTREWLLNEAHLDATVVEALLAEDTRPRAVIKKDGVMVVFRAMNLHEGENPENMISLRMWIDDHHVITCRLRDIKAIEDIQELIAQGEAPTTTGDFLQSITSRLFARMEPFVEDLGDDIAAAEERMVLNAAPDLGESMFPLRKRLTIFRRYVTPQKLVLQKLHEEQIHCLRDENQQHFGEELDRVTRYVEELDELAIRLQLLNEELHNAHAERLNNLTYVFSVVATLFLPLTFLTGLLDINVSGIPAEHHPYAFWVVTGLCVAIAGMLLMAFKKFKWF